jgi:5-carboxymethyl-2-hydroxymuconate isomerase
LPHLVILYTSNLESKTDISKLCRSLADAMLTVHDENSKQVFPTGGTRVLAYPAPHFAIADGKGEYSFLYLNLRMGKGRSQAVKQTAGETVLAAARAHCGPLFDAGYVGLTFQIDEGQEAYDAKVSTIHPLFARS